MGQYNIFANLKKPRDITNYTLMRGTTDWSQLQQFDLYESGYPYLIVVSVPDFITKMAEADKEVQELLDAYVHILEYEFRGWDSGLEAIQGDTSELTNGKKTMNVITSTTSQGGSTFSASYFEKSGSTLTKFNELYLRSVRDPESTFKHYGGLIGTGTGMIDPQDAGWHKESFSFLYMHTDNTGLLVEKAAYIVGACPLNSDTSIYNGTKGNVEFKEISLEFTGFPIIGSAIDKRAKEILDWMNNASNKNMVVRNSYNYDYAAISDTNRLAKSSLTRS